MTPFPAFVDWDLAMSARTWSIMGIENKIPEIDLLTNSEGPFHEDRWIYRELIWVICVFHLLH